MMTEDKMGSHRESTRYLKAMFMSGATARAAVATGRRVSRGSGEDLTERPSQKERYKPALPC
jgi:hypothetical protein